MKGRILFTLFLLGCGADANVAGNYSIALTNGDNGCNLSNFTPGNTSTNVGVTTVQDGSKVTMTINGTLDGDVLRGRIEYRAADNGNSDCSQVHGCLTYQDYNGTRPPQ